jgi:hypothetical protein
MARDGRKAKWCPNRVAPGQQLGAGKWALVWATRDAEEWCRRVRLVDGEVYIKDGEWIARCELAAQHYVFPTGFCDFCPW